MNVPRTAAATDADVETLRELAHAAHDAYQSVESMAISFVREAIVEGVYPPGHRLDPAVIAAVLGVSRMPVRAGLRQLELEGLVQISRHRGAAVTVLDQDEVTEIYDLRILLENHLLAHSIDTVDGPLLDELTQRARPESRRASRQLFCEPLYARARRPRILAQLLRLHRSTGRYGGLRATHEDAHLELVGLLAARDLAGAQAWTTAHLRITCHRVREMVAADRAGS